VYTLVDAARKAAIETVRPGATIGEVHDAAVRTLVEGLIDLRVLSGDAAGLVESEAHKPYYPHQTSHWLGLDVHDPGDYARNGSSRVLEPGMVFSVEPGLYFRPGGVQDEAEAFAGIGVRIEDDVVVTRDGCEVPTRQLATAAADVEALVRDRSAGA
ncbi:MAG: M24 family metallopeptidase, partial [Gemmatimonadetes bacterium]|nr:M24 family metallopeptidase [Gemmatimonadota bacterium]NIU30167.1 M24 family metallopeptidase [Gemmatimonadota bacterium]NIU72422.1 M24 family metallopeptidase [Gammaproteobacteria bacterium]NIV60558.1 M24 family metallopeptidase [Gemmatimonadota bacterium]NIY07067.1 M24 family metallopeptidase [Gemmatimonadota bacterium]